MRTSKSKLLFTSNCASLGGNDTRSSCSHYERVTTLSTHFLNLLYLKTGASLLEERMQKVLKAEPGKFPGFEK